MGCNHCLEPTCLRGCPVNAYTKDAITGIVRHSADACIGCQYCTWTCSYGVPQYDESRGVVGKCDMCHARLEHGQTPACVTACPEGAIAIEVVRVEDWRTAIAATAPAAGLPVGDGSVSTTRMTLPRILPPDAKPIGREAVEPQPAHWTLVLMTVLTQLAVGAFGTIWLLQILGPSLALHRAAASSLVAAAIGLTGATLHLGRPLRAYRAFKGWRHSWLSREVLLFTAFGASGAGYTTALWLGHRAAVPLGAGTVLLGLAGVAASACIYRVRSRPAWDTSLTLVQFITTAALLGPLTAVAAGASGARGLVLITAFAGMLQLAVVAIRYLRLTAVRTFALTGAARLLSTRFKNHLIGRGALLAVGGIVLPLAGDGALLWAALLLAVGGELLGRYLFFVTAVPVHMLAPYVDVERAAA
jgi:DMSO reductase anchor subunit/ferredoxin